MHKDQSPAANRIFGENTVLIEGKRFLTGDEIPLLSAFAENAECDYFVSGISQGYAFSLYFPLKIYTDEQRYKHSRWDFLGSCFKISAEDLHMPSTYIKHGRIFDDPDQNLWIKTGKAKGAEIWSYAKELSDSEKEAAISIVNWVDEYLCALWSTRYAITIDNETIAIAFWRSDLYDPEGQMRLFDEAMQEFPKI